MTVALKPSRRCTIGKWRGAMLRWGKQKAGAGHQTGAWTLLM